ncbi:MAG: thiamine pyrophosphate-dependent enzyme [Actinomycetota bacterium]|nr:thiamine pyrophosphate-dependent enzyme [Actinomycetota bacterium]
MNIIEAVDAGVAARPRAVFVSSLGTSTSALRRATQDGCHLYLGGAMGSGLAVALGLSIGAPDAEVVAIVGDGDLIMGSSALWDLAGIQPTNLTVVVMSDGRYAITGGQVLPQPASAAAVAGSLGVASGSADDPEKLLALLAGRDVTLLEARLDGETVWPGPSPFVEPSWVTSRLHEVLGRPGAAKAQAEETEPTSSTWQVSLANALIDAGANQFTYVPDARISETAAAVDSRGVAIHMLTREEQCVGFAAGAAMAGASPVVMMQCSGLGNSANALGSLALPYGLGMVLVLSMRGTLGEANPSQVPMGQATYGILDALGVQRYSLRSPDTIDTVVKGVATLAFKTNRPVALILEPELGGRREYA